MTRILAIDDNQDNLIVIKAVLATAFHDLQIITSTSGRRGIELARSEKPDVILLDLIMPEMDGFETCRIIKEDTDLARIPVIVLTALQSDPTSRIRALKMGAESFLTKPIDETELVAQVTSMVRLKRSEDKIRRDYENLEYLIKLRTKELEQELNRREKAEETLVESEERLRLIVKNASDILVVLDPDGNQRYISPAVEHITGCKVEEVTGLPFSTVIHPDDLPQVLKVWTESIENPGKLFRVQYRHIHKTRDWVWLEAVGQSFLNEPSVRGVIASVRDISGRLEIENVLQKAATLHRIQYNIANAMVTSPSQAELFEVIRRELSQLLDTRNFFLAAYDEKTGMLTSLFEVDQGTDGHETWPAADSLTGYVIRMQKSMLLKKDEIRALVEAGEVVYRGNRSEVWVGVPLVSNGKSIACMVLQNYENPNAYDEHSVEILEIIANQLKVYIERRKAIDNEIKLSKALVQSPVSICITDTHGNIEYVNPKICEVTGYSQEELLGQNTRIFKSGNMSAEIYRELWSRITRGGEWRGELENRKKNGELFWESVTISAISDADGKIMNYLAVKEDITDRRKTMAELEEARIRAEASDRLKSAFLENISHEIRTPLNGILGFAPMILDPGYTDEERMQYLQILNESGKRLMQTVTDYMDISLLTSKTMKVKTKTIQLGVLLGEIQGTFNQRCIEKSVQFSMTAAQEMYHVQFNTDTELLRKVFFHLLDNAVKFTDKGKITFDCKTADNQLVFTVTDTGTGISPNALPHIFDKFFQEDTTRTRSHEGSGLGLTIVAEILKLLQGGIKAESTKGIGTEFTFFIPVEPTTAKSSESHGGLPRVKPAGKYTIIAAEDDEDNFFFLKVSLRNLPVELLRAKNGSEALELFNNHPDVSLVLMDLKMPEMDGYEATKMIKRLNPALPVIAVTAYAMTGDEQKTEEAGCDAYLAKPFTREQIIAKIKQFVPF